MKPETITAVIAIAAVISPVLTAWINNYYKNLTDQRANADMLRLEQQKQEEIKHQKFIEQTIRIRTIYEKYAEFTLEVITSRGASSIQEQGKYFGLAMLYVNSGDTYLLSDEMSELQELLIHDRSSTTLDARGRDQFQVANNKFSVIAPKLSKLINNLPEE